MSETTETTAPAASANGAGPVPDAPPGPEPANLGERLMFAVMLLAGAGLVFLAVDGLTGYALTRAFASMRAEPEE